MFFQKVVKGISGIDRNQAARIVEGEGIRCNWWRLVRTIKNAEIKEKLTEDNLMRHLNEYANPLPADHPLRQRSAKTYGDVTPYISTTAGAVQRDTFYRRNVRFPPMMVAWQFATNNFRSRGWVFFAYLFTIGKRAVPLYAFSEEVRELHVYTGYLPFHHEGEIVAKIDIQSVQIEKAEEYDGPGVLRSLRSAQRPSPMYTIRNSDYEAPEQYANIRELL